MRRLAGSFLVAVGLVVGMLVSPAPAYAAEVVPPVTLTTQPVDAVVVAGADTEFTAAATDAADADVPVSAWQSSDGAGWTDVAGSAGQGTLSLSGVAYSFTGTSYRAVFDDGLGGTVASTAAVLTVLLPPTVTEDPADQLVHPGTGFELHAAASGDPQPTVRWQVSNAAGGPWTDIAGATGATYVGTAPTATDSTTWYRAVFTSTAGSVASEPAAVRTSGGIPAAVASVSVSNPAPRVLRATWPASAGGGAASSYLVTVTDGGTVVSQETTSALQRSFNLTPGVYRVSVVARNGAGDSPARVSSAVAVRALARTSSASGLVVRPVKDGFQDSVVFRAGSNFATSGSIRLLTATRKVARTWSLAAGTSWSVTFAGKDARGKKLRNGRYTVEWSLAGSVFASRSLQIASSKARALDVGWAQRTFYPRKDGYRDKNRLVVHTNVPATISVSIAKSGSAGAVKTKKWSKRMSAALVWNGKKGRSFVAPGTYRATITVKGRVGKAKSYSRTVTVSGKQLRGRSFTGSITATNAYVRTLSGSPSGFKDGSMWLWSDGDEYDIVEFGGRLPASFGGYGSTRMYACADSASDPSAAAAVVFADRSGQSTDRGFALSRSAGCTSAAFPTSYIDGRNVRWYAGNVSDYFSYQEIGYFKFTTTIYELR